MAGGFDLGERGVLITGATRGLGYVLARRLAAEGCHLAICARSSERLAGVADELRAEFGVPVLAEALDVTDHAALARFVQRAGQELAGLHAVVANVGGSRGRGIESTPPDDWAYTFDVNVTHAATLVRAAVPYLAGVEGVALLVSSISGWKPAPTAAYGAAKAALIHLAATLARELGRQKVRVNAVCPGSMLIPGRGWDRLRVEDPQRYVEFEMEFPAGRLVDPQEVASVMAFLLSDHARAINGALIPVDGGQNAPSAYGY